MRSTLNKALGAIGLGSLIAPPKVGAEFMKGGKPKVFQAWHPQNRETRDDVRLSWDKAQARANDLIQNTAWIAGAVAQATANTVGCGLRLVPKPDHEALGMTKEGAKLWALDVARKFETYASTHSECDVTGKWSFYHMQAVAYRSWLATGEIVASAPWRRRYAEMRASKIELIPAPRFANLSRDYERIYHGVKLDEDNRPIGYVFYPPKDTMGAQKEDHRKARDRFGRVLIAHVFDGMPGQVRGITPLAPALGVAKQFDQLTDATLASSIIQSLFAATLTADLPTNESLQSLMTVQEQHMTAANGQAYFDVYQDALEGWSKGMRFDPSIAGRVASLFPGQKLDFVTPGAIETNYAEFAKLLLREIARCIGITYEEMSGDYAGVTFSSVRMATDVIWRVIMYNRTNIMAPFCNFPYVNWMEEMVEAGEISVPGGMQGFLQKKSAICRAQWVGTPKPQADDLKGAKTLETLYRAKLLSGRRAAAIMGEDIDDIYAELAEEAEAREKLDLDDPQFTGMGAAGGEEAEEAEDGAAPTKTATKTKTAPAKKGAK